MASSKRIGFFWGEEKITLVEFEKNAPLRVIPALLDSKTGTASPFSSNLSEEIGITAIFQKMLQENSIKDASFHVSLPMKEIILRSFIIPLVKPAEIPSAVKFEARKYLPIDIHDLAFVFHTIPFLENKVKRLQVIFFAVRKESLEKYERVFRQVNATVSYCEPCVVSLAKVLLFKKEISPTDQLAFLVLDRSFGRICFIDRGIPQFIREFSIASNSPSEESPGALNLRIVNEVGNSFDFYARQFSEDEKIDQLLVSSDSVSEDLFNALEAELKLKLRKVSPIVTMDEAGQSNDMDTIYAMGACVEPPMEVLSGFNFLGSDASKSKIKNNINDLLEYYKEIVFLFLICVVSLVGVYFLFQAQLKSARQQYDQLAAKQGSFLNLSADGIQAEMKGYTDNLAAYKNIRTRSDVALMVLKVASHLPKGALLKVLNIAYDQGDSSDASVKIDMDGEVIEDDPNEEIAVVNQIFSDIKNDKKLSKFIKTVNLTSLNREDINGKKATGFVINCF